MDTNKPMVIQNGRKTSFENELIHLIKVLKGGVCSTCDEKDFWKLYVEVSAEYEASQLQWFKSARKDLIYQNFTQGLIPAEQLTLHCKHCLSQRYERTTRAQRLEKRYGGRAGREKQEAERALRILGFGGQSPTSGEAKAPECPAERLPEIPETTERTQTSKNNLDTTY